MFEAAGDALVMLFTLDRLAIMAIGVGLGLFVGVLPGLGGTAGMAVLLPFIFGMDAVSGIALLIGMAATVHTADTFPSVLLGVPGSSGSQATILDGYPLARMGEAGRALGAAFTVSLVGGIFGAVIIFATLSVARPLVLSLQSPELFMLAVLGLSMVSILSKGAPLLGLLTGLSGLLFGAVGGAPGVAVYRFTFDWLYLMDGVPLPVLALALFAIPEMVDLLASRSAISKSAKLGSGLIAGVRDAWKHRALVLRSSALGAVVGMIPGIGGSAVDWIAYGVAKQTCRDSSEFGKGDIRGVIAPESANNAKEGGALVPTLLFGIPGSGTSAMLLGGLIVLGVQTGPRMADTNLELTLVIIWTLALANIMAATMCFALSRGIARMSLIPARSLVPFIFVIIVVASYQSTRHWGDILTLMVVGLVGWLMKQLGWPRAPFLIGFILAGPAERFLHLSMSRYGLEWLSRPRVIVIGLLTILIVGFGSFRRPNTPKVDSSVGSSVDPDELGK